MIYGGQLLLLYESEFHVSHEIWRIFFHLYLFRFFLFCFLFSVIINTEETISLFCLFLSPKFNHQRIIFLKHDEFFFVHAVFHFLPLLWMKNDSILNSINLLLISFHHSVYEIMMNGCFDVGVKKHLKERINFFLKIKIFLEFFVFFSWNIYVGNIVNLKYKFLENNSNANNNRQ